MRFIKNEDSDFRRKTYIQKMKSSDAMKALKVRLNMIPIFGNFKGDMTKRRLCPHCEKADDTTEHLITCRIYSNNILKIIHLTNDYNVELWRQIVELIDCNLGHRPEPTSGILYQ